MSIKGHLFGLFLALMLFVSSFAGFDEGIDNPLSITTGVVKSYSFGRGGAFSLLLKTEDGQYKAFDFLQFRSVLSGQMAPRKGKLVRISHYGDFIADCWAGSEQFCFSHCSSDRECRIADNQSGAWWLRAIASLIVLILLTHFLWCRRGRRC